MERIKIKLCQQYLFICLFIFGQLRKKKCYVEKTKVMDTSLESSNNQQRSPLTKWIKNANLTCPNSLFIQQCHMHRLRAHFLTGASVKPERRGGSGPMRNGEWQFYTEPAASNLLMKVRQLRYCIRVLQIFSIFTQLRHFLLQLHRSPPFYPCKTIRSPISSRPPAFLLPFVPEPTRGSFCCLPNLAHRCLPLFPWYS